jgi:glycerophosphoryl diester phosphodiesterase
VTKDGVVVVSHDRALNPDHTRDDKGQFLDEPGPLIRELSYAELQQYDVGRLRPGSDYALDFPEQQPMDGERIPRLAEVFELVRKSGNREVRFNIETKIDPTQPDATVAPEAFAAALIEVIRAAGMESRTTIQSFDWRTLVQARKLAPEIAIVALTDQQPGEDTMEVGKPGASVWLGGFDVDDHGGSVPKTVKALGATVWSPHALDLNPALVAEAQALGLAVIPWTVNEPEHMERALALGIDGLITDQPDRLRGVLQAKGMAVPSPTPAR